VPAAMGQADLDIQLPRAKWASFGVTLADGKALPSDNLPASLLLPMGRLGPAFLVYQNFQVYLQWNNSLIYSTTAAYLATRIAGAAPLRRGNPPASLPFADVKAMQGMLAHPVMTSARLTVFSASKRGRRSRRRSSNTACPPIAIRPPNSLPAYGQGVSADCFASSAFYPADMPT
jgi:hypothetical protein